MRNLKFIRVVALLTALALALPGIILQRPDSAFAAASLFVSAPGTVNVGDTVTVTIRVSTGGQSANAFEGHLSYPTSLLEGVRGTYSGSICTLPIVQPEPSGGGADFSCGTPSGYNGTGTVATVVFTAKSSGTATFGLSACSVLANDGQGTNITGGCSGGSTQINGASSTPTPTPPPGGGSTTPTPKPTKTPTPKTSPTPTKTPSGPAAPVEQPNNNGPGPEPTPPPAQPLPENAPNPETEEEPTETVNTGRRTIAQAIQDLFGSLRDVNKLGSNLTGVAAVLLALIPVLGLGCAIVFMIYRLYLLERRRRRTLDRLFEMELGELAALEGKMDLLAEKGSKGREQYREEFRKVKENILRQLRPDYAKPVDAPKAKAEPAKTEEKPAEEKKE